MEQEILNSYSRLNSLNVSRETYLDFELFISMVIKKNKVINIISEETAKIEVIRERHIIDSAQIIDFIDLNSNTTTDLGTGGGMPGIVIAIILKNMQKDIKVHLYEKSHHKSAFLRDVSRKLNLKTEIFQENIFHLKKLKTGTIMSRAFKPMPIVLELVYKNFLSYKNLIFFMGKNGKKIFENSLKEWDLEYIEKKSLTNEDSFLLNIKKIKKKIKKTKCKSFLS
jgi:16S rRNA (guanine527-N7)-methyltransferase